MARKAAPSGAARAKVEVRTPNVPGYTARVDALKYEAMRKLLLRVVPRTAPGVSQAEMFEALARIAPKSLYPGTTYAWWGKCVQLDLEARGVLRRDPKAKPLRWVRAR